MKARQKDILFIVVYFALIGVGVLLSYVIPQIPFIKNVSNFYLLVLCVLLDFYILETVIDKKIKKYVFSISIMITLLILFRGLKYIAFDDLGTLPRYLWYLYYLPVIGIPCLSLGVSLFLGQRDKVKWTSIVFLISIIISIVLLALILTNDFHQLAFSFQENFQDWDSNYQHGFVYYFTMIFSSLEFIGSLVLLLNKCSFTSSKKKIYIPMIPAAFGLLIIFLQMFGVISQSKHTNFIEFPETYSFMVAGIYVGFIYIGLIPSNRQYKKVFTKSSIHAQILSKDHIVKYQSENTLNTQNENIKEHQKEIKGGYVKYFEDISEINQINESLAQIQDEYLMQENLERTNAEMKAKKKKIEQSIKIYDEISEAVLEQSEEISRLAKQAETNPALFEENLSLIRIYASYIKRHSNLILLSDNKKLPLKELELAISESYRYIKLSNYIIEMNTSIKEETLLDDSKIIQLHHQFQKLLEIALKNHLPMFVYLNDNYLQITLEQYQLNHFEDTQIEIEDNNSYIRIPIQGEKQYD